MSTPELLSNMWPDGIHPSWSTDTDDVANNKRWGGGLVGVKTNNAGNVHANNNYEWQYIEHIYVGGGMLHAMDGMYGDWCRYEIVAPLTAGTVNGGGTGDYDKAAHSLGGQMFVPNTGAGGWDLDLVEKLNANVAFTKVVPVPNPANLGHFDWNHDTEAVTQNANGKGAFDIVDTETIIHRYLADVGIMGSHLHPLSMPNIRPAIALAHWKHRMKVHVASGGSTEVKVQPMMLIGRHATYPT